MFSWFRKKGAPASETEAHFDRYYAEAEGTPLQRKAVAAARVSIDDRLLHIQRQKLPPAEQKHFMVAYECMVMWCLLKGMEDLLPDDALQSVMDAVQEVFARYRWYNQDAFEKIWEKTIEMMPIAFQGGKECPPYPVAEMLMAANMAGYPVDKMIGTDLEFGMKVTRLVINLIQFGRLVADEHVRVNG